jgi:hypothetical protein
MARKREFTGFFVLVIKIWLLMGHRSNQGNIFLEKSEGEELTIQLDHVRLVGSMPSK